MHSESNQTTLVREDWEKYGTTKIGHSESFWTTLVGKDEKKCKTSKLGILSKMPKCSFPYTTHMLCMCPGAGTCSSENYETRAESSSSVLRQSAESSSRGKTTTCYNLIRF